MNKYYRRQCDLPNPYECPNCDGKGIEDHHAGDVICVKCGMVIGDRVVEVNSEWRPLDKNSGIFYTYEPTNSEAQKIFERVEGYLGTGFIMNPSKDANNNDKGSNKTNKTNAERKIDKEIDEISEVACRLHLPDNLIEIAHDLYKQFHCKLKKNSEKYRNAGVGAACVYLACKAGKTPRSFKEVCGACGVDTKTIGRSFKKIVRALEISQDASKGEDMLARYCGKLSLPYAVEKSAKDVAAKVAKLNIMGGCSPNSIAGLAIYIATYRNNLKPIRDIADVTGAAAGTILKHFNMHKNELCFNSCSSS